MLQRVWTLQEYCCASQMIVVQEDTLEATDDEDASLRQAVAHREAIHANALRREYMAMVGHCTPVWLSDNLEVTLRNVPPEKVMGIVNMYSTLSEQRHCRFPEDAVRALYGPSALCFRPRTLACFFFLSPLTSSLARFSCLRARLPGWD